MAEEKTNAHEQEAQIRKESRILLILSCVFMFATLHSWYFYFQPSSYVRDLTEKPGLDIDTLISVFVLFLCVYFFHRCRENWGKAFWSFFFFSGVAGLAFSYWDENLSYATAELVGRIDTTLFLAVLIYFTVMQRRKKFSIGFWPKKQTETTAGLLSKRLGILFLITAFGILAAAFLLAFLAPSRTACKPAENRTCSCENGATGSQFCKSDGSDWDKCNCFFDGIEL